MGLDGPALVESINACPPIEPDDGTGRMIFTGTMRHLVSNVLDVSITGLDEPLGVTDTHPIWSETRHNFVTAGQLRVGEHLRSESGAISQVTRITPKRGPPQLTYNLEVNGEHVYQVGASGLLVHNSCSFFDGTHYTDKVLNQMSGGAGELHSFPEIVRNFEANGAVKNIVGGDGVAREMLEIPGSYTTANGRTLQGVFEFIKEPGGAINHRYFHPVPR